MEKAVERGCKLNIRKDFAIVLDRLCFYETWGKEFMQGCRTTDVHAACWWHGICLSATASWESNEMGIEEKPTVIEHMMTFCSRLCLRIQARLLLKNECDTNYDSPRVYTF